MDTLLAALGRGERPGLLHHDALETVLCSARVSVTIRSICLASLRDWLVVWRGWITWTSAIEFGVLGYWIWFHVVLSPRKLHL